MNDQDILCKIEQLAKSVYKPSRGVTSKAEPTISFTLFKTWHSRGKTTVMVYRCRITKTKKGLNLTVNDHSANTDDEERIYCLLLELNKFQKANNKP